MGAGSCSICAARKGCSAFWAEVQTEQLWYNQQPCSPREGCGQVPMAMAFSRCAPLTPCPTCASLQLPEAHCGFSQTFLVCGSSRVLGTSRTKATLERDLAHPEAGVRQVPATIPLPTPPSPGTGQPGCQEHLQRKERPREKWKAACCLSQSPRNEAVLSPPSEPHNHSITACPLTHLHEQQQPPAWLLSLPR